MQVHASVALVTGPSRGRGLAIVKALRARGAKKIYAGVRDPAGFDLPDVIPVKLDVTRPEDIAAAGAELGASTCWSTTPVSPRLAPSSRRTPSRRPATCSRPISPGRWR